MRASSQNRGSGYTFFWKGKPAAERNRIYGIGFAICRSRIKDEECILHNWKEHYHSLLNRNTDVDVLTTQQVPQHPELTHLNYPPSLDEVATAIKQMKNNKASGPDGIPAEVYKAGGTLLTIRLHSLLENIWEKEEIPQALKDTSIVNIYKNKGDRPDGGNYRGISLLSIAWKITAQVLRNRLLPEAENFLPES